MEAKRGSSTAQMSLQIWDENVSLSTNMLILRRNQQSHVTWVTVLSLLMMIKASKESESNQKI